MDEHYGSPPNSSSRIARPRGFLPLNTDEGLSTRGQTLGALIGSRSTTSLQNVAQAVINARRRSVNSHDEETDQEGTPVRPGAWMERKLSIGAQALMNTQMRSMRLIGNSNPRYQWEKYWKTEDELKKMKKPLRQYYERTNSLIQQYIYIDKLLDSSLPHDLIQEYGHGQQSVDVPPTITEESGSPTNGHASLQQPSENLAASKAKVKRTPRDIYRVPHEDTPLLSREDIDDDSPDGADGPKIQEISGYDDEDDGETGAKIVQVAIYINLAANTILLAGKIIVIVLTSSLSVLASLVDAALDFLSTAIVWTTTRMIARQDQYAYPVGRRRLEPIGVLVFAVIMITSFFQVFLECFNRLTSGDHSVVELTLPAILIMASTVVIKFMCWLWCRLIKNSSVQALAQDAMTDVVFNTFSIIFPLVGFYLEIWYLDALGGLLLSLFVILNWSFTSNVHIRNLTGAAATADERNVLLYLTMRFAKTIRQIQGLQAYHAGDKLNVEVDIVLDEVTTLRDSHDLGESLQYVLESVPYVDRAFVHLDYAPWNLPSHLSQQS